MEAILKPCKLLEIEELRLARGVSTDRAVKTFAEWAEAKIVKWIQFPRGVLLFLMVPGDPDSGQFYLLDRPKGTFYELNIYGDAGLVGYRQEEFEKLAHWLGLLDLAQHPHKLRAIPQDPPRPGAVRFPDDPASAGGLRSDLAPVGSGFDKISNLL
jgi:hypothetical protein